MFLPLMILLVGVFLISDGFFRRGILIVLIPNLDQTAATIIRLSEIVLGGVIFFLLGQFWSKC